MRGGYRVLALLAPGLLVAGCAGHRRVEAPQPASVAPATPPAATASSGSLVLDGPVPGADGKALATIWHMRVALNVAALACRGGDSDQLVAGYNKMLRQRRELLAAAETALIAQYGGTTRRDAYDKAMTRLYNLYARPAGQQQFCKAAARIQRAEGDVPATRFADFCADAVVTLNEPFAHLPAISTVAAARRPTAGHPAKRAAKHTASRPVRRKH